MSLSSAIAIFFVIWWITLFAVLPWRVRTQAEEGEIVEGSNPSSPARSLILWKLAANTVVAAVVFAAFLGLKLGLGLTLNDIPLLPRFD